ncbi:MAG: type II toxin-antitoxin system VapC family toxin [Acidobacteria bacterium]|nr:type II toxin-antitoxin system VapC family toxin [Acidobacteriota bacterium]
MNYLDSNFATALHFNIRGQTELAEKFVRKNSAPFIFSELAELECRRAFLLRTGKSNSENWIRLTALVESGAWRRERIEWKPLLERAAELIDRFGLKLKAGTLDTLHVAQALNSGCTRFLSFDNDSNARVLAVSCRLKVYPELSALEKGRIVR